jgi:hypothetical protein
MDFSIINSGILAANAPDLSKSIEKSLNGYQAKIEALVIKIYKPLPTYVCVSGGNVKDLPKNKRCPKGYEKTELPRPF